MFTDVIIMNSHLFKFFQTIIALCAGDVIEPDEKAWGEELFRECFLHGLA
jgi:hypothetical protein